MFFESKESPIRAQLIRLGSEALADMLLNTAAYDERLQRQIEFVTAPKSELVSKYKDGLLLIKSDDRLIDWNAGREYAQGLEDLLQTLRRTGVSSEEGIELVKAFFELDTWIVEHCHDEMGYGCCFKLAADLFSEFAAKCADKKVLIDKVVKLCAQDKYGVRQNVMDRANEFLDESALLILSAKCSEFT